ncbi:regulator [Kitasatospora sp. NPDC005751]|uniref:regulator n=1 Tax=Kitasatospora sp. NPDC005751 TaxID=3157064 RepID=UPI00340F4C36
MATKQPNLKLAAMLALAQFSNQRLARHVVTIAGEAGVQVSYDHVSVKRWLDGAQPRGAVPQFIATALSRKLGRPVSLVDIGMETAEGPAFPEPTYAEAAVGGVAAALSMIKADLAGSATATLPGVSSEAWTDLMVQWLLAPDDAQSIDPRDLSSLSPAVAVRYTTESFAQIDYRFGGGHARQAFLTYFESGVAPALRTANAETQVGQALYEEGAALLRLIAWSSYDMGMHGAAQRYFAQALRLAQAAGNRALGGRILAGMSHQANFLGDFDRAVNLARTAVRGAGGVATATGMALFHAMEARALASKGDEAACIRALALAESWFERRSPQNDPYWLHYFDEAELAAEHAHCFRELGKPGLSAEYAARAMALHGSQYVRSMTFVRTVLATSHIARGELDQGLSIASDVVDVARGGLQSVRTAAYIREFLARLQPYRKESRVEEFHRDATGILQS